MDQPWLEVTKQAKQKVEEAQKELDEIVVLAAKQGVSWVDLGEILGMTRQGARQKYTKVDE